MQGMVVNESLKRVQLSGCSFLKYSRGNGDFNPNNPNGTYTLKLEDPVDRQICLELCRLRVNQGNSSWSNVKLDGKEIKEDVFSKWPKEALPISGVVQVTFQWIKRPSTRVDEALSEREFEVLARPTDSCAGTSLDTAFDRGYG